MSSKWDADWRKWKYFRAKDLVAPFVSIIGLAAGAWGIATASPQVPWRTLGLGLTMLSAVVILVYWIVTLDNLLYDRYVDEANITLTHGIVAVQKGDDGIAVLQFRGFDFPPEQSDFDEMERDMLNDAEFNEEHPGWRIMPASRDMVIHFSAKMGLKCGLQEMSDAT